MSAPATRRSLVVCRSKRRHPDEFTARAAAMTAIHLYGRVSELYVYRCAECRGWHLTRFPTPGDAYKVTATELVQRETVAA